jgi:hypothetical protein
MMQGAQSEQDALCFVKGGNSLKAGIKQCEAKRGLSGSTVGWSE